MAPEYIHTVDITVQIDTNKQTKRKSFDAIAPALTYLRDVAYGRMSERLQMQQAQHDEDMSLLRYALELVGETSHTDSIQEMLTRALQRARAQLTEQGETIRALRETIRALREDAERYHALSDAVGDERIPNSASFDDDSMTGWVAHIMEWCERKGWNDGLERRSFGDWCTLMHTEISEAYEEYRDGHALDEVYRKRVTGEDGGSYDHAKPEGVPTEIADLLIRVFHLCAHLKLNPGVLIAQKMAYNETRPYRHGGKVA